jgi:predicted mannosyl-3-phosphoglycerate phosphatase (HAD superfamily)
MSKQGKIVAVDFDGTVVDHEFPKIGKLKPHAKEVLNRWYDEGIDVIIWTCRNNVDEPAWGKEGTLRGVMDFLDENGIKYVAINENAPSIPFRLQSRKVYADLYIDDRNVGGFPGWVFVDRAVKAFYETGDWRNTYLEHEEATLFEKQ